MSSEPKAAWVGDKNEEDCQETLDYLRFMSKPEVIKMNLDILYKSVPFLSKDKINSGLESYKQSKK